MSDKKPVILAIDDTPANLRTLAAALGRDFDLVIATSGEMGLTLARQASPDLILLDVMMPQIDGYETCRRLKADERLRMIPVIFLTALGDFASESKGLALGAADYIAKPFNIDIARQRISNLLEREELRKSVESHRDHLESLVTERTAKLMEQTTQLDAIFALSPDGFVSFDQDNKVKHVNSAFTRMTGLSGDKLIGLDRQAFLRALLDLCVASPGLQDADDWFQETGSGSADDADPLCLELTVPAGRMLEVRRRQNPGKALSQVLYFHDISQMMEVDRMKSEFLSLAAHELRTPMASIFGFSEVLSMHDLDEETRQDVTTTIHRQARVMSSIIDDLVDLAGIEARHGSDFSFESLSLIDITNNALLDCACPEDRQAPVLHLRTGALRVSADQKKLGQAIRHVIANAYAYSPAGKDVSISFHDKEDGDLRMLGIAVKDCGMGMSPEQQQRCCERFYRGDQSGQTPGTGLGLSIVLKIVDIHGGQVSVESTLGQGTTVTLWLPEATAPAARESAAQRKLDTCSDEPDCTA